MAKRKETGGRGDMFYRQRFDDDIKAPQIHFIGLYFNDETTEGLVNNNFGCVTGKIESSHLRGRMSTRTRRRW